MENIIKTLFEFTNINSKCIVFMQNHDYPRITYCVHDFYIQTKKLLKLLRYCYFNLTNVQKQHIKQIIKNVLNELNNILLFIEKYNLEYYEKLYICILNLQSI